MKKIVYISDFFIQQNLGGAEICDEVIISNLIANSFIVDKILSKNLTINYLLNNKNSFFIFSNFSQVNQHALQFVINHKIKYIIYEHDHKYAANRNPAEFKDYLVPKNQIVNEQFYKDSIKVIAQSNFHKEIIYKNLLIDNIITFSTNFWFDSHYDLMLEQSKTQKNSGICIIDSPIWHKNTTGTLESIKKLNKSSILISDPVYENFLIKLGSYESFAFLPKTPETFSRTCAEARMMNVQVITNNNVGCVKEDWFKQQKGEELIKYLKNSNAVAIKQILLMIEA